MRGNNPVSLNQARRDIKPDATVASLYSFSGSAHLAIQVLRRLGMARAYVMSQREGSIATSPGDLGAQIGFGGRKIVRQLYLDAAILFTPAGNLVQKALEALDRGGWLGCGDVSGPPVYNLGCEKHLFYEKRTPQRNPPTPHDGNE